MRAVYEREDFIADPLHYLALIERKPRANAHGQPAIGDTLCGFVRTDHTALH